jgi:hypothetical protein
MTISLVLAAALFVLSNVQPMSAQNDDSLRLEEAAFKGEPGDRVLTGKIQNTTHLHYSYVEVRFRIVDSTGTQIGSISDTTSDLAPQATWNFEIDVPDNAANFELTRLHGDQEKPK